MTKEERKVLVSILKELREDELSTNIFENQRQKREILKIEKLIITAFNRLKKCKVYDNSDIDSIELFLREYLNQCLSNKTDVVLVENEKSLDEMFEYVLDSVYGESAYVDLSENYLLENKYEENNFNDEKAYINEYSDDADISYLEDHRERYKATYMQEELKDKNKPRKNICLLFEI